MPPHTAPVGRSTLDIRGSRDPARLQKRLEALVRRQWGVVERRQLLDLGWSGAKIDRWIAAGRLLRLYSGVYALGHAALLDGPSRREVHVTTPRRSGRAPCGFTLHRVRRLAPEAWTVRGVFRCTTAERTILDLADLLALRDVERLVESAEVAGVLDIRRLCAMAEAAIGRRGRGRLSRALDAYRPRPEGTRSELEARFLALCARHRLPTPRVGSYVDGSWSTSPGRRPR